MVAETQRVALDDPGERLASLWSVRLPRWLDPWAPRWADALADGAWTAAVPRLAALAPLVALAVGVLAPRLWPGMPNVYSESLPFMALVVAGAILSGPVGVMLLLGYAIGDATEGWADYGRFNPMERLVRWGGSHLISYLLLAILAQRVPLLARQVAEDLASRLPGPTLAREGARLALYPAACGLLVYLWCQAMIVLVRPLFTWRGDSPTKAAVEQVQLNWEWLVAVAAVAAVARLILEHVAGQSPRAPVVARLQEQRWAEPLRRGAAWQRVPALLGVALGTGFATLLLAGAYTGWIDPLLVAAAVAGLGAWRAGLIGRAPPAWLNAVSRVPPLVRLAAAPLLGYLLARQLLSVWSPGGTGRGGGSFEPVLAGMLITLVIFYLLFPRQTPAQPVEGGGSS